MSVLIKGMELPKCCLDCRFCWGGDSTVYCIAQRDIDNYGRETLHHIKLTYNGYDEQQSWREDTCPLVEVPPHGRLIDADKAIESMDYVCDAGGWLQPVTQAVNEYVKKHIDVQETVLEEEGEENG